MPSATALPTETETDTPLPVVDLKKSSRNKDKLEFQDIFASPRSAKTTAAVHVVQELAHNKKVATAQATAKQSTQSAVSETQKQLKLSEAEITRMRDELKRAQNELLERKPSIRTRFARRWSASPASGTNWWRSGAWRLRRRKGLPATGRSC